MALYVPWMPEARIELDAEALLDEFAETIGAPVDIPVPVVDITLYHLALQLGFADLHDVLSVPRTGEEPDILGAIWPSREAILIDASLDPSRRPSMLGRYRFSVGHEVGHWRLHGDRIMAHANQATLFDEPAPPAVICRTSQAKSTIEWQADFYASCLLMPKRLVLKAWQDRFGDMKSRRFPSNDPFGSTEKMAPEAAAAIDGLRRQREDEALNRLAQPFAEAFQVSTTAMRIRLEQLSLLHRTVPRQTSLKVGA